MISCSRLASCIQNGADAKFALKQVPKPMDIKEYLDEYIIGQDQAKRHLAVAVYNHYKRLQQPVRIRTVWRSKRATSLWWEVPGTGKTLLDGTIAKLVMCLLPLLMLLYLPRLVM